MQVGWVLVGKMMYIDIHFDWFTAYLYVLTHVDRNFENIMMVYLDIIEFCLVSDHC